MVVSLYILCVNNVNSNSFYENIHNFLAYGFGLVKGSIVIYATLINKQLQSHQIDVNNNKLKFIYKFIWYLDNATLKK